MVDALVRKGVLSTQEAEEVRQEMTRESGATPAGKLRLNDSLSELKLYGDTRLRYQFDNKDFQVDNGRAGGDDDRSPSGSQRSRWRFRLRLNADFKLGASVFGGVELQTGLASDSANQTFENAYNDYPIFISKAYLGWSPTDWLTVVGGKVPNPFYTTDLVWDPDVNPTGAVETLAFHKLYFGGLGSGAAAAAAAAGYSKDGKSVAAAAPSIREERPWELTLVAGQFIYDDNLEGGGRDPGARDNDETNDTYAFQTQLIGAYKFSKDVKLTVAPGWLIYTSGSVTGAENENAFNDDEFVSGAARNLNLLLLPGDLSFKVGSLKAKLYWDLAYNLEGRKRVENLYSFEEADVDDDVRGATKERIRHETRDNLAWLAGVQVGENKKKGDWSLLANYRETGIGSVDPNINENDFAAGELNMRGFKLGMAYNLSDFAVFGVTYFHAWNLRSDLRGGEATRNNAIADSNAAQTLQVDLNVKF